MSRPAAYMPYQSEASDVSDVSDASDSDKSDASDASDESNTEDPRVRREQDPRYAILRAPTANRSAPTMGVDDSYGKWDPTTNIESLSEHVYLDPPKTTKTSLVSIKSINRDRKVYATPYRFQLKLPRVYKNVTKFQMVQLSFPNSNSQNLTQAALITCTIVRNLFISGVPSACISDCISLIDCTGASHTMGLIEQGRVTASGEPMLVSLSVPDGNYTEPQLASELTFRANSTPPFYLITYEAFREVFMTTRDILVLYNEPGECFYSSISHRKWGRHSKQDMMNVYYTQEHLDSFPEITERIAFNAYYYPVLKEAIATQRARPFIQTDVIPYEDVVHRVVGIFEGLDSEFYYQLGQRNRGALDVYRRHLTFQYRNINKYICNYHEHQRTCTVVHDALHPSLQRDLSNRQSSILEQEIRQTGCTREEFHVAKQRIGEYSAVVRHLETNLSTVLASYHFVEGYQYRGGETHSGSNASYSTADLSGDLDFTTMFQYTSTIGGQYGNYRGVPMRFESFTDYQSSLSGYYDMLHSTSYSVSCIQGNATDRYHRYVSSTYGGVLPAQMIENRTYTVPQAVPVSVIPQQTIYVPGSGTSLLDANMANLIDDTCKTICCSTLRNLIGSWYSCLPTQYVLQTLPYRLGLINILPNQFNLLSTVANITTTGNLNLFMQINDEQGFNNMDVTMPENYMVSNETTGQVKLMCAKILMGAVGDSGISQTVIQNPSLFDNGLGKLDKLDIKIYYDDPAITPAWLYEPYYLELMEWNATFQIDEEIGFANRATGWGYKPTIPVPKNADETPYLFYTHKSNPNNS